MLNRRFFAFPAFRWPAYDDSAFPACLWSHRSSGLEIIMKARLLMILAVVLLIAADKPPDPLSKKDLHRLQGTWTLVSATQDGKALAEDKVIKTTIVFKDDTFRFPGSAEYATSRAGTIKIDATKTPR